MEADMKKTGYRRWMGCLLALMLTLPLVALGSAVDDGVPEAKTDAPQTVRVLLTRLALTDRLDVNLNGAYSAEMEGGTLMFGRGSDVTVLLKQGRMYLYYLGMSADRGTELTFRRHPETEGLDNGIRFANNTALYEGDLTLRVVENQLQAVLTLGLEDYVKGVVPYEMSDSFPLEALKAQAVAARTYVVYKAGLNAKKDYDVVDNTNDQVYKGRREEYTQSAKAVEATAGVCGFYKGKLAMCYYSASNGGQTELASHVWDTHDYDGYLDMRDDPYDLENPQSKVQSVTLPKKTEKVTDAPYALRLLLSRQLRDTLVAAGYDPTPESLRVDSVTAVSVDTPRFDAPSRLYTALHITFTYSARTRTDAEPQATPTRVWVDDDVEVSLFTPEPLAPPSETPAAVAPAQTVAPTETPSPTPAPTPKPSYGPFVPVAEPVTLNIPIFPDAEKALSLGINSYDNEMVTVTEQADSFTVESRRFGHGVGLSQRGAEWMAGKYEKTYVEILAFYYPGMTLMRYTEAALALPTVAKPLTETAGPIPTPTPRPTLMPVTQTLPDGAWYAEVTEIDDDSSLNLRATPDSSGDILMKLYKGQQLIVLEECPQEDWVRVKTDAIEGYVMEKFLTQEKPQ